MKKSHRLLSIVGVVVLGAIVPGARASELLTNGTFETGTFTGWTATDQAGGSGSFFISTPGTPTPLSGSPTAPNASGGNFYAVTDQTGPGAHALTQSFTVPLGTASINLSFQMFVNDWDSGPIVGPLDYTGAPVEYGRVDILTATAAPLSTAPGDIVDNLYLGADNLSTNPNLYTNYNFNLTGILTPGATYQVRFAEADNQSFFNLGVDNVSVTNSGSVPDGGTTLGLFGLALAGMAAMRRKLCMT